MQKILFLKKGLNRPLLMGAGFMVLGQTSEWTNIRVDKRQSGQTSEWTNVIVDKRQSGQTSEWTNVRVDKRQSDKRQRRQSSECQTSEKTNIRVGQTSEKFLILSNSDVLFKLKKSKPFSSDYGQILYM